jgi:hypothetical protein
MANGVHRIDGSSITTNVAWMLSYYDKGVIRFPIEPAFACQDINDESVVKLVAKEKPDLVIVSGTNLLRNDLIKEVVKHGKVINLHTGISPYVKRGPNCMSWCSSRNSLSSDGGGREITCPPSGVCSAMLT